MHLLSVYRVALETDDPGDWLARVNDIRVEPADGDDEPEVRMHGHSAHERKLFTLVPFRLDFGENTLVLFRSSRSGFDQRPWLEAEALDIVSRSILG